MVGASHAGGRVERFGKVAGAGRRGYSVRIEAFERVPAMLRQFAGFTAVGAVGTGAHFLTLIALVRGAGLDAVWSSFNGSVVGAVVNYLLNYHLVFRSNKRHGRAMIQFLTIAAIGLALNSAIMAFAVKVLGLHYLLSQVVATGTVLVWNFMGNRSWTFR